MKCSIGMRCSTALLSSPAMFRLRRFGRRRSSTLQCSMLSTASSGATSLSMWPPMGRAKPRVAQPSSKPLTPPCSTSFRLKRPRCAHLDTTTIIGVLATKMGSSSEDKQSNLKERKRMDSDKKGSRSLRDIEQEVLAEGREWTRRRLEQRLQEEADRQGGVFPPQRRKGASSAKGADAPAQCRRHR